MFFKNICILVLWTKLSLALEGLNISPDAAGVHTWLAGGGPGSTVTQAAAHGVMT